MVYNADYIWRANQLQPEWTSLSGLMSKPGNPEFSWHLEPGWTLWTVSTLLSDRPEVSSSALFRIFASQTWTKEPETPSESLLTDPKSAEFLQKRLFQAARRGRSPNVQNKPSCMIGGESPNLVETWVLLGLAGRCHMFPSAPLSGSAGRLFLYSQRSEPEAQDGLTSPWAGKNNPPAQESVGSQENPQPDPPKSTKVPEDPRTRSGSPASSEMRGQRFPFRCFPETLSNVGDGVGGGSFKI